MEGILADYLGEPHPEFINHVSDTEKELTI